MGAHVAGIDPELDMLVADAIAGIGAEISALHLPRLRGVVLGGGYGRGEGGVKIADDGTHRLSNDLDFYVVAQDGSSSAEMAAIGAALSGVSAKWTTRLGVDVDFCAAKTPWRMRHDQDRLMIQELLHGYFDVAGERGESMFEGIARMDPKDLPWLEAARLMMNRGVGLLLALERGTSDDASREFSARNINKCVLGAYDARLIVRHAYVWRAEDRARALESDRYSAAVAWKFRPSPEPPCTWEEARETWLDAMEEVRSCGCPAARRRGMVHALRWLVRRRTLGAVGTLGLDPVLRVLDLVGRGIRERRKMSAELRRDWQIFN